MPDQTDADINAALAQYGRQRSPEQAPDRPDVNQQRYQTHQKVTGLLGNAS